MQRLESMSELEDIDFAGVGEINQHDTAGALFATRGVETDCGDGVDAPALDEVVHCGQFEDLDGGVDD